MLIDKLGSQNTRHRASIIACLVLLCSCGETSDAPNSAGKPDPSVASLQTPGPPSAKATPPPKAERPLVRMDASEEERTRLQDAYFDCMIQNGLPKKWIQRGPDGKGPADLKEFGSKLGKGVAGKIEAACASKQPEREFDRAKRLDPEFDDNLRAMVKCLNDHGIRSIVQDGNAAGLDGLPSESKGHWLDDCERQAFGGYYSTLD